MNEYNHKQKMKENHKSYQHKTDLLAKYKCWKKEEKRKSLLKKKKN